MSAMNRPEVDRISRARGRLVAGALSAVLAFAAGGAAVADSGAGLPAVDSDEFAGMAETALTEACASACHGFDLIFGGPRRVPQEWDTVVEDMVARGATATEDQLVIVRRYLKWAWGTLWINSATADDLVAFLAIPQDDAEALIAYRDEHGPFADIASLKNAPGVDAAAIDAQAGAILFN